MDNITLESVLRHASPKPMYSKLDRQTQEIRLLKILSSEPTIQVELHTVSLHDKPPFDALSYVWGGDNLLGKVDIDGVSIKITQNLQDALHDLHHHWLRDDVCKGLPVDRRRIWADALCINQDDPEEKNHQLPLMQQIYQGAEHVFSWLGRSSPLQEPGEDFNEAFDVLEIIGRELSVQEKTIDQQGAQNLTKSEMEQDTIWISKHASIFNRNTEWRYDGPVVERPSRTWHGIIALLDQGYWTRVWIFQEIFLAQDRLTFIGGRKSLSFHTLRSISLWLGRLVAQPDRPDYMSPDLWSDLNLGTGIASQLFHKIEFIRQVGQDIERLAHDSRIRARKSILQSLRTEYHAILVSTLVRSSFAATDRRDYILGLLGISKLDMDPDYSSSELRPSHDLLSLWQDACHDQEYQSIRSSHAWKLKDLWFLEFAMGDVARGIPITLAQGGFRWRPVFHPFSPAGNASKTTQPLTSQSDPVPVLHRLFEESLERWEITDAQHLRSAGVVIDRVGQLSPGGEKEFEQKPELLEFLGWVADYLIVHPEYHTGQDSTTAMQRALLNTEDAASLFESRDCEISEISLLFTILWRYEESNSRMEDLLNRIHTHFGHGIFGPLEDFNGGPRTTYRYRYQGMQGSVQLKAMAVRRVEWTMRRALITAGELRLGYTEKAYLGRFPEQSDIGDEIWLLRGYDRPVILRWAEDHYIFVGSAYIVDPLGGRTPEEMEVLKSKVRLVEIY